tara:strand:- start:15129 stop:16736 length:1608 start_codon:yes stop_codon:yes gene_type:complete
MGGKKLVIIAIWLVVLLAVGAVLRFFVFPAQKQQQLEATSSSSQYDYEVALGLDGFSGYAVLRSEEFQRRLRLDRIRIEYRDDGADYSKRIKGLANGDLDLAVFTLDSLISSSIDLGDLPGTVILVIDETAGADAIVAKTSQVPNLQALDDPDARIIGTGNSPSEFLSRTVRANFDLPNMGRNWFEGVDGPDEVMKKLRSGSSDPRAYALWEPYVSQAREIPGVEVIFDSSAVQGYVIDVLVARRGFLTDNYEQARRVIEAYLSASYSYRSDPDGMVNLVMEDAKALGEPLRKPQAEAIVDGIIWRNTLENFAHFGLLQRHESGGIPHIEDAIVAVNDVLIQTGAVPDNNKVVGSENLLYFDRLVSELQSSRFHPEKTRASSGATLGDALSSYDQSLEAVRSQKELERLTASEWDQLRAVGQIKAEPISFGRNSTRLYPQGQRDLRQISDTLRSFPNYYLQVVGHVAFSPAPDMTQDEIEEIRKASMDLAQTRADAVKEYLISIGVHENRIRAVAAPPTRNSKGSVSFLVGQKAY